MAIYDPNNPSASTEDYYDPNGNPYRTGGVTGTAGSSTPPNVRPDRAGIANAYKQYLGRDIRDHEYDFWAGNNNYASEIANSPEAKQYAATGQGGSYFNPGATPLGFDATKWNDPNHSTPKYQAGRLAAAGASVEQIAQALGAQVLSADTIRMPNGEIVDVFYDVEGAKRPMWEVVNGGAPASSSGNASGGSGSGGSGSGGRGGFDSSGSVFSDPATSQWEQLLRQVVQRLTQRLPDSQLELQQTQALDPLERQRQQQKQQAALQLSRRGITQNSGIWDDAMANIDRQFEELRTRTQAGFANSANQSEEQRLMQAVQMLFQIPQYQDSRLQLANSMLIPSNPYQLLNLQQQYQNQANQQAQYNTEQQQAFYYALANAIANAFNG